MLLDKNNLTQPAATTTENAAEEKKVNGNDEAII